MNSNNSMIVRKENIFKKFFQKLKSLFIKEEINIIIPKSDVKRDTVKKEKFVNSIVVDVDFEIQALKVKLDNGEIKAIDLNDEQIDKLQAIYDKEIAEKKLKLQQLKKSA